MEGCACGVEERFLGPKWPSLKASLPDFLHLLELRSDYESFLEIFLSRSTHLLCISTKLCLDVSKKRKEAGSWDGEKEKKKQQTTQKSRLFKFHHSPMQ